MSAYLTSILLASLFAVQSPEDNELKNLQSLNALCKQHEKELAPRCAQESPGAAVYAQDEDLALRTAVLYREQVALLEQRQTRLVMEEPGDSDKLRENSLSMARVYRGAARMLRKAYECNAVAEHLYRAEELVLKARVAAGDNDPIVEELDQLGAQIAAYIAAIPPPAPAPAPCQKCRQPEAPRSLPPAPPPWAERLSLRLDLGFASGRMIRSERREFSAGYSHGGVALGLALLGRAALAPRWALLFGPSYTYWRAEGFNRVVTSGNSHQVAAHLEIAAAVGRRRKDSVSVYASLEAGLQHVVFDGARYAPVVAGVTKDHQYIDRLDIPMTGGTIGGAAGVCFGSGSICAGGRVSSVPGNFTSSTPTVAATVGLDFFAIARASRARKVRLDKSKVP